MAYDFKYVRTGTGELSGPSMIWQTEQALTQIGTYADEANTKAEEALETANTALDKANEAAEAAERAQNTADEALAAAGHAQETADGAQAAAEAAQDTADEALETAKKGVADAAKAQAAADKAQDSADKAQAAADEAQLAADNAQTSADKAQEAADNAQATADTALNNAASSQGAANVAQDTADNALLVANSTREAFYEHLQEYNTQILKALGEFEVDNTTTNFDNFTEPVKLYITSKSASITGPNGKVNAPFYLWNFTTDDRVSTAQFVYAANGLTYCRYGVIGSNDLVPGTNTYTLVNNKKNAILTCKATASAMTIAKSGSLTNTWTASDTHAAYITGTWVVKGIAEGAIDINDVTIANLSSTGFYPTGQQQLQEENSSFAIDDMAYDEDTGLTIQATVQWLSYNSQITWDDWKVNTPAVDDVTIHYNTSNELQAQDVAIGGNEKDLASARGQIGEGTYTSLNASDDFNTYTKSGIYKLAWQDTAPPKNAPTYGINGVLSVFAAQNTSKEDRIKQMWYRYGSSDAVNYQILQRTKIGDTWGAWTFVITSAQIGDGIKVTADKISVPEMVGATTSKAGTDGLVPAPTAADNKAGHALLAKGDWGYPSDVAIAGDQSDLASDRGFIVDLYQPWYTGSAASTYDITDFDDFTTTGCFHIRWREGAPYEDDENPDNNVPVTANNPNFGNGATSWFDGTIEITKITSASYVSPYARYIQKVTSYVTAANTTTNTNGQRCVTAVREYVNASSNPYWTAWRRYVFEDELGPGQNGDAVTLTDPNFNTVTKPGFYYVTGSPTNGPSVPGITGASIGVLQVAGVQGSGARLFQIMTSANVITWRTSTNGGSSWTTWLQLVPATAANGIAVNNGVFEPGLAVGTTGTITLNPATASLFTCTVTGNITFKFSSPQTGKFAVFTLIIANGGTKTITWPSTVNWAGDTPPELTTAGRDIITFISNNSGNQWYGVLGGTNFPIPE